MAGKKNDRIISDDFNLSEESSTFFKDAVRLLNVKPDEYYLSDTENLRDPAEIDIEKFENHPLDQAVKKNITVNQDFFFSSTKVGNVLKETTAKKNGIPVKCLNEISDFCAPPLNDICNKEIFTQKCFPNNLKLANVTTVFKNKDASMLKNYRPVSVLPVVFKIYERIMQNGTFSNIPTKHLKICLIFVHHH